MNDQYPEDRGDYSVGRFAEFDYPESRRSAEAPYHPSVYPEYANQYSRDAYPEPSEASAQVLRSLEKRKLPTRRSSGPLRMACIGPNFRIGGVRQHALALVKFLNPERLKITEFVVNDTSPPDPHDLFKMPVPVSNFNAQTVTRLNDDCDILLMWGDGFNQRLAGIKPFKVFVAHGETQWTRNTLLHSSQVVEHVIAVSDRVKQNVCHGFPATTILNGVDTGRLGQTDTRENVRRRFAFGARDYVIGSVGRLTQEKQFDLLIRAVGRLPSNFKLLLVGSGRRQSELLELANRFIPGRFAIVPAYDYLGDYYQAMDAFAMVSAHEGFGLVLAEAMMCGRPVIATPVGVAPEVISDRVNGLLVEPDVDSIASAAKDLHSHRAWAKGMAMQGKSYASQHLNAAQMARRYEDLLCDLFARRCDNGIEAKQ